MTQSLRETEVVAVPLLVPAAALAAGSAVSPREFGPLAASIVIAGALFLIIAALVKPRLAGRGLYAAFFAAGTLLGVGARSSEKTRLPARSGDSELVSGCVVGPVARAPDAWRFDLKAESLGRDDARLHYGGVLRVTVRPGEAANLTLHEGDCLSAWAETRRPNGVRTPGGFDEAAWAERGAIDGFATVKSLRLVTVSSSSRPRWYWPVHRARTWVQEQFDRMERGPERAVAMAMILGDTAELDPSIEKSFRDAGLLHILVVSGAQIVWVVKLIAFVTPRVWRYKTRGFVIVVLALGLYCAVAGSQVSVVRATLMAIAIALGRRLDVTRGGVNGLSLAAILVLIGRPLDVADPGAQLSFVAAAALILLAPSPTRWLRERGWPQMPAEILVSSTVATIATAPVVLTHFGTVSLTSVFANMAAAPLAVGLLPASLALLVVAPLGLHGVLAPVLAWLAAALIGLARFFAAVSFDISPPRHLVGLFLLTLVATLVAWKRGGRMALPILGAWAWMNGASFLPLGDGRLHLYFLDVGQGDAAILVTPGGRAVAIDAGPAFEAYDAGERVVVPAARALGIRTLETLVLTHPHADHEGGAPFVARALQPSEVLVGPAHVLEFQANVRSLSAGAEFEIDGVLFRVLAPSGSAAGSRDANDRSLVIEVLWRNTSFLFLGDAPAFVERRLDEASRPDVVKVAHHGARTSSAAEFVRQARPTLAVFSVGARNRFAHPSEVVVARWRSVGAELHRTDLSRTLHVATDGHDLFTATAEETQLRRRLRRSLVFP